MSVICSVQLQTNATAVEDDEDVVDSVLDEDSEDDLAGHRGPSIVICTSTHTLHMCIHTTFLQNLRCI